MASKINKVKIDVTANTKNAEKNLENLSKAETRLGQTTASAGRQFSSQAQGLGGLVAAYAGAAANVFALQQAFDALRRAAQAETIVQGTKALALEIAASGGRILENVREITQGQLTLAEAAQNTNIALSAGFGSEQIERLTQVSIKASRALGRSLTDALTRVTRGAAKLEPELLDELGIFTRIDPAVEKYAAGLNVAASSLTNYERRQAFVNAVIEEGERKFSTINTAVPSSQKSIERLITALTDLATEFGQVVANTLQPFIDFIADNTGVALLAFLGVLRLVFGKAGSLIGAFSKNSILSIDKFASNLLSKAKISKDALQELTAAAGADFRGGTGIGKGFPTKAAGVSGEAQEQFNVARQQLTSGSIENAAQLNTNIRVLENFSKQAKLGTKAQENLNNVIAQGNAQLKSFGFRAKVLIGLSNALNISVTKLSTAFSFLGATINFVFAALAIAQLVGTLFDVDILGELSKLFKDLTQDTENLTRGTLGFAAATAGSAKELEKQLKGLGANKERIENINKEFQELAKNVDTVAGANLQRRADVPLQAAGDISIRQNKSAAQLKQEALAAQELKEKTLELGFATQDRLAAVDKLLAIERKKSEIDRVTIRQLELLREGFLKFGNISEFVGAVSGSLGLESEKVANAFNELGTQTAEGNVTLDILGLTISDAKMKFRELGVETQKNIESVVLFNEAFKRSAEAFENGSASAETLSKQLGGARAALKQIEDSAFAGDLGFTMVSPEQLQALQEAKNDLKELNKQVRELKQLETIGKQITGNFGSSIKLLDNAVAKGLIGPDGIAKDSNEIAANQAKFLAEQVLGNKQNAAQLGIAVAKQRENLKAQEEIFKLRADEVKLLANRDAALKSMAGMSLQLMQAVEKEKLSQEKILATLRQKLEVVKAESALKDAQRDLEVERANQERINKLAEANLSISERQVELAQAKSNAINKEFEAQEKLINLQDKELALRDRISKARAKLQNQGTLSNFDSQIASLQNTLAEMQFFPGLSSEEDRRKIREQIINLEFEKQMEVIDQKRTQALAQFFSEIEAVDRKKAAVEREIKQQDKLISDRKAFALLEEQNLAQQQSIDIKKLEQEKSNLQAQLTIIDKEEALAKEQNKAAAIRDEFIKKEALMRIDSLVMQSEIVNKFAEAVGKDTPFVKAIEALVGPDAAAKIAEATSPQKLNLDTNRLRVGVDLADMLRGQVRDITSGIGQKGRDAKRGTIGADITAQEKLIELTKQEQALTMQLTEAKNTAAIKELENERKVLDQKLANIALERDAVEIENMAALDALDREEQKVIENYQAKIDALNRERDMISQFASDVSLAIGGELKNSINGFFQGIAEGKSVLDSAKDAFGQFMQKIIGSIQEKLTEKFISPVIDSILGGIFAGGGPVQLAGGGAMRRDRVPALLEPGEFVIRKPMAKAIGGPALSAMNGHGKGLGMPTIDVQINNSGQPKDAEAQVKPNMDVNKMVVEIVTRDLRNNGPIRKTLRGDS